MNAPSAIKPRVLVLLASRDGAEYIGRQIDSVLVQRGVAVRLDVRDDGSGDATVAIVERYAALDGRIRLRADRTPSGSAALNFFSLIRGAELGDVDYVAFCDQDDEWYPEKLSRAIEHLRDGGHLGYSAAVRAQWPDGRSKILAQSRATTAADYLFEGAGQGCTFLLDIGLFCRIRNQLEQARSNLPLVLSSIHYHDWLVYALARAGGAGWFFDPTPVMMYRQHAANDTGARGSGAGVVKRLNLIRSRWYQRQVLGIAAVVRQLHPDDPVASRWLGLASARGTRIFRFVFVARAGRRRVLDRAVQLGAIAFGYL